MVSAHILNEGDDFGLVAATQRGAVKKMKLEQFELSTRAKRGLIMLKELKKSPPLIGTVLAGEADKIYVQTEKGLIKSFKAADIKYSERYSNGSFLIDEAEEGKVTAVWKISGDSGTEGISNGEND